ncbi:MAG: hypothetical protein IKC65_04115 [Lentisphaeria bacterium]|nr:hypothetical protein [Lentisphaeria bacterium]
MKNFCDGFRQVPSINTPAYFWFINFEMDQEELLGQLHDMYAHGARSVCLHPVPRNWRPGPQNYLRSEMSPDYLTEEYFAIISRIVQECVALQMHYYLYDEGGWPSGSACGEVLAQNPKWKRQWITQGPDGKLQIIEEKHDPRRAAIPDVTHPGATEEFIRLTHEQYKKHIAPYLGTTVRIAFMDEPATAPCGADKLFWTPDFPQEFLRRKGYDIMPFIPDLLKSASLFDGGELVTHRIDYHEVRTQLFIERFLVPIQKWCRQNNMLSGGHFDGEDSPEVSVNRTFGAIMKSLRALDVPGVDLIWRQIWPGTREHSFPRFASSVAHQQGNTWSLGELFGVYGNGMTPEMLRYIIDYCFVHGLNLLVYGSYPQRNAKNWLAGCRTHFGPDDPLWKYFDEFHTYAGRISYLLSSGSPLRSAAVVFDTRSLWAENYETAAADVWRENTAKRLREKRVLFDYIDEDMLSEGTVADGVLTVGPMHYTEIILPAQRRLTPAAEAQIALFAQTGGKVITDPEEASETVQVTPLYPALWLEARELPDNRKIWFFFNAGNDTIEPDIFLPGTEKAVLADPLTGKFFNMPLQKDGSFRYRFGKYDTAVFISGMQAEEELPEEEELPSLLPVTGDWQLTPLIRHAVGRERLEQHACAGAPIPAAPGDWRRFLGEDFSGDARYTISFDWDAPIPEKALLDLGKVNYCCQLTFNQQDLGKKFHSPFVFDITQVLRRGRNTLDLVVTNTLANAYSPREVELRLEQDWPPRCAYEGRQRAFEREALDSGLHGPVLIRYKHH